MEVNPLEVKELIVEIEKQAQLVLDKKGLLLELDKQRQGLREGLRRMGPESVQSLCLGNTFIQLPREKARRLMEKDLQECEKEIEATNAELKDQVAKLYEMEGKDKIKGMGLKPLSKQEATALQSLIR
ncbi:unnamed protein product [Cyprideis torosa]|uniref:P53 and DNA damage-regulated protein 1 n=1 Tax=Cyprideis torosa TaxID=163714 RepID=A0A7R8ZTP3_9CRUS|nr:unnamed protein product [Cyprideis torosa]CAG0904486.1 unnamed protein product [Cyprideis torosa]